MALADYDRAVEECPDYAPYYIARGEIHKISGNYQAAVAEYSKGIILEQSAENYSGRALLYKEMDDYSNAIADCTRAMEMDDDRKEHYLWFRGSLHRELGDFSEAASDFQKAVQIQPNNDFFISQLADLHISQGDYRSAFQAETAFSAGSLTASIHAEHWKERAKEHQESNEYERAIDCLTYTLTLYCSKLTQYFGEDLYKSLVAILFRDRGSLYRELGDVDRAIADYTRAMEMDDDWKEHYLWLRGSLYRELGDVDRAITDFRKAVELEPDNSYNISRLADFYISQGDYPNAFEMEKILSRLDSFERSNRAFGWLQRAKAHAEDNENERAIVCYNYAFALDPDNFHAYMYHSRGELHCKVGNHAEAIVDLSKAIELDPTRAWYYEARARSYEATGDNFRASADRACAEKLK